MRRPGFLGDLSDTWFGGLGKWSEKRKKQYKKEQKMKAKKAEKTRKDKQKKLRKKQNEKIRDIKKKIGNKTSHQFFFDNFRKSSPEYKACVKRGCRGFINCETVPGAAQQVCKVNCVCH